MPTLVTPVLGGFQLRASGYVWCILLLAANIYAKEPKHFQSGKIVKMQAVKCGIDQKDGKNLAGEMIGTDSSHLKTRELLCQEYVLETSTVMYIIRPKDEKHPMLLPIGETAQFRLDKDKLRLRIEDLGDKERQYDVISMTPNDSREGSPSKIASR